MAAAKRTKQPLGTPVLKGTLVRELQVTSYQHHKDVKHQLRGNSENYLSGHLHSYLDVTEVL